MRPQSRLLFGVLLALCLSGLGWSGLASADPHQPRQSLDSSAFRAVTHIQLDIAFERFASQGIDLLLYSMAGPSSMNCTHTGRRGEIETCVVTTHGLAHSIPAALAQR